MSRPTVGLVPAPYYRQHPPIVITGLGPVIDLPDAVASKARALNDRRAARDYLDIHVLLSQPGWTPARLLTALPDNLRPVITAREFAADLAAAGDQDPRTTTPTASAKPASTGWPPTSPSGPPSLSAQFSARATVQLSRPAQLNPTGRRRRHRCRWVTTCCRCDAIAQHERTALIRHADHVQSALGVLDVGQEHRDVGDCVEHLVVEVLARKPADPH